MNLNDTDQYHTPFEFVLTYQFHWALLNFTVTANGEIQTQTETDFLFFIFWQIHFCVHVSLNGVQLMHL